MNKYGRPLKQHEKQRLYRLRRDGKVTDDMAGSDVLAMIDAPRQKRGPRTTYKQIPQYVRRKLREVYNLTPTQLMSKPEQERNRIWQVVIASRGIKLSV